MFFVRESLCGRVGRSSLQRSKSKRFGLHSAHGAPSTPSDDKRTAQDSQGTLTAPLRSVGPAPSTRTSQKAAPSCAGATALPAANRLPAAAGARHTFVDGPICRCGPARRRCVWEGIIMSRQVDARVRRDQRNKVRGQGRAGRGAAGSGTAAQTQPPERLPAHSVLCERRAEALLSRAGALRRRRPEPEHSQETNRKKTVSRA